MATPLLNARVDTETVEALDALAAERGVNRSDLVRLALADLLAGSNGSTTKQKGKG
jgi:antitoxin component of RelBE/YafQ-DinJ toxin-antitoxin module